MERRQWLNETRRNVLKLHVRSEAVQNNHRATSMFYVHPSCSVRGRSAFTLRLRHNGTDCCKWECSHSLHQRICKPEKHCKIPSHWCLCFSFHLVWSGLEPGEETHNINVACRSYSPSKAEKVPFLWLMFHIAGTTAKHAWGRGTKFVFSEQSRLNNGSLSPKQNSKNYLQNVCVSGDKKTYTDKTDH